MKLLKLSDLTHFWGNVRKHIPTKTSDLTNDSNFAVDSNVLHKSGNETSSGFKTFSSTLRLTAYPSIRMYMSDDEWDVQPAETKQSEIRFTDKNSVIISYFGFQHRSDSTEPFRTCWRQKKMDGTSSYFSIDFNNLGNFYPENDNAITLGGTSNRWNSVYATNYYYGANNVEFSNKFVTTDTAQTVSGVKTFSDDTYIKSLNFTNEAASTSSSSSAVMPLVTTVTYTDQTASKTARLNLRITASGDKSLYPHENNQYALGLTSRKWSEVHGVTYYYGSSDTEFSTKFVTSDTAQTITERKTFTKNVTIKNEDVTIGSTSGAGSKDLTFTDSADNSLAKITANKVSNGSSSIAFRVDTTDNNDENINTQFQFFIAKSGVKVINPTLDNDISLGRTSNRWKDTCTCLINGLEPSALSMPDKANGIDISSYITIGNTDDNYYTPSVNGWIWAKMLGNGLAIQQGDFGSYANYVADSTTGDKYVETCLLVTKNVQATIRCRGITSIVSAYFYPCLGNV